jgi:LmbE family N-acetylglucosaminyl deacetylase
MGVFAHPDDESLLAGGTLALARAEGIRSLLVTVTRGERGGKFSGIYGKRLAITRTHELVRAAAALNITTVHHLQIPDMGVRKARVEARNTLIDIISRNTPQIIVTHDPLDTSQHSDHIATARAVVGAVTHINPSWPHVILFAAFKPNADRLTYALDIDSCRDIKMLACQAHASQGLFRVATSSIPVDVYYAVNHFEYFIPYENETTADVKRHHTDKK